MFLSDQETATDLLHYEAIAKTVVRLIRDAPNSPVTIGVHGDWGAGKSSVLKMTQQAFTNEDGVLCLWFNGWAFEGFEDAKTVIIETIIEELQRAWPKSTKVADAAKKLLKRVDWLKAAKKAGGLAFTVATGLPTFGQLGDLIAAAKVALGKSAEDLTREDLEGFADSASGLLKPKEEERIPAHIHAFRKEFVELLDAAEIKQLVVVVDDLDRCLPETAIATLEAIRLFLFVERTAFVIGADETMIEYAVREHFPDLPPTAGPVSYARNYLEKLIQVPFRVPAMGPAETRTYITLLLVEAELGSENEKFKALLDAARDDMRRPWLSTGITRQSLVAAIGEKLPEGVDHALVLSSQISGMLTDGTRGNPRQVKRFLNSMKLRHAIGEERGFGGEISTPILAKLMLAERFNPDFFEHIVRLAVASDDGKPAELQAFEETVRNPGPKSDPAPVPGTLSRTLPGKRADADERYDWSKNDWATTWARLDPPLAGVDLRPYVFVTRDKRMVLGGASAATHLDHLAEKLMGPVMSIKAVLGEVGKLAAPSAEELFDIVRMRILAAGEFKKKPEGLEGLMELVAVHPTLERRLLEFLREIPIPKAGPWLGTRFDKAFKNADVVRDYEDLRAAWEAQTVNKPLATAAGAAKALPEKK